MLNIGVGIVPVLHAKAREKGLSKERWPYASIVELQLRFDAFEGRYVAMFVGLRAGEVTGTELREIRVAELVRMASAAGIFVRLESGSEPVSVRSWWGDSEYHVMGKATAEAVRAAGPVKEVLKQVALVYNIAQLSSQPPAKSVEAAFGLTPRTAARWIAKAREQEILVRPALPGYEKITRMADEFHEALDAGDPRAKKLTAEEIQAMDLPTDFRGMDG